MTNEQIADNFSLLAKIMDIHGDNAFKSRSYSNAAYQINQLNVPLSSLSTEEVDRLKGIGDAIGKKIREQLISGELSLLKEYLNKTPAGIIEMLSIKGLGPKKIATIWKELEIETMGELLYACNENRLTLYKGFGEKTQKNIKEAIEFYLQHQGLFLYAELEGWTTHFLQQFNTLFPADSILPAGAWKRQLEIIPFLNFISSLPSKILLQQLTDWAFTIESATTDTIQAISREGIKVHMISTEPEQIFRRQFELSADLEFIAAWNELIGWPEKAKYQSEEDIFKQAGVHFIPAPLRENKTIIEKARKQPLPDAIRMEDIRGIIHSHSQWSDGSHTIEEMARAARKKGLEYLVISDHSRSAFYANGLSIEKILAQHREIEQLNAALAPFTIFKSIESDILSDGSLDYPPELLSQFDLVIASIHSNLKMPIEKSMHRLLTAVQNPYTTILGHPTGRLLLSRNGYPVDHEALLTACAQYKVVVELNAHPRRLDIDWRWIERARELGVLISINPDAHTISGMNDIKYGVMVAQKAGISAEANLSSFNLTQMKEFIRRQKSKQNEQ